MNTTTIAVRIIILGLVSYFAAAIAVLKLIPAYLSMVNPNLYDWLNNPTTLKWRKVMFYTIIGAIIFIFVFTEMLTVMVGLLKALPF